MSCCPQGECSDSGVCKVLRKGWGHGVWSCRSLSITVPPLPLVGEMPMGRSHGYWKDKFGCDTHHLVMASPWCSSVTTSYDSANKQGKLLSWTFLIPYCTRPRACPPTPTLMDWTDRVCLGLACIWGTVLVDGHLNKILQAGYVWRKEV